MAAAPVSVERGVGAALGGLRRLPDSQQRPRVVAVRAAARGQRFLSAAVAGYAVDCLKRIDRERTSLERLTPRKREVLQLVAEGHTTKEIAKQLGITAKTAEAYRGELMSALDIHDIASLTRYAIREGLVSPDT